LSVMPASPRLTRPCPFPHTASLRKVLLQRWHLQCAQHLQLHGHGLQRSRLHPPRWAPELCQLR
jgi:hypothetical protein